MFTPQNWKKLKEEPFRAGYRKLLKKTFQLPNGKVTDFDIKDEGQAVCVLALNQENKVILGEQFRPGVEEIILEMPGGGVDGIESPLEAIRRELLEETGYTGNFELVGTSYDCAYSNLIRYNFVATDCYKSTEQNLDESEFIKIREVSLEDFRKHLKSGKLTDVESGYLGLDYLGLL